jgi:hypothetical protein
MRRIGIRYFNDPVAVGVGRIGLKRLKFLVISFVGSGSLRAVSLLLNYRGRSEQSYYLQIKSNFLRVRCKLVATFSNFEAPSLAFGLEEINNRLDCLSI